ncbi:MAG: DUF1444 family protein [Planctomycetes bacterium]|nr:DUF1444 family protein [Planctomycetota bacterium]MCH9726423.1 DUF1444 family protein [Planctomycetota bacterium]MCH9778232.1 DUF1444 family protein [Planctomycetota bacterium]MDF1745759.1 DUF1444 family protein [Gimesia sp.]
MSEQHFNQWVNYTGPAHWYSLSYPEDWVKDEKEGILQLSTPDGNATLTISCHWQSLLPQSNYDSDLKIDFDQFFVKHRKVQKRGPLAIEHDSIGYSGEAIIQKNSSWWRELLTRVPLLHKQWHHWNLWLIRERAIQMVVTFFYDPKDHENFIETVQQILHSVQLSQNPSNPPDLFANEVLRLAQNKFPLASSQLIPGFRLKFADSEINLTNFYRAYLTTPEHFEKNITTALATILQINEWGTAQTEPELIEIQDRIMPILISRESWEQNFPNFLGESWVADLAILYVVDESNAYWYIHEKLLEKWGIDQNRLHEIALENLDRYFDDHQIELICMSREDGPNMIIQSKPDAYNASQVLSPSFYQQARKFLGSEFLTGVPNRDFLLALSLSKANIIDKIQHNIASDYLTMDHPLTDQLLVVTADGVSEYCGVS